MQCAALALCSSPRAVAKPTTRGSLMHDPKGSHYGNQNNEECSCPIYGATVPDKSGNYKKMKVKILSTKYEILNNTKAQMRKIQNKTSFGI